MGVLVCLGVYVYLYVRVAVHFYVCAYISNFSATASCRNVLVKVVVAIEMREK